MARKKLIDEEAFSNDEIPIKEDKVENFFMKFKKRHTDTMFKVEKKDVPPDVIEELRKDFYASFEVAKLYQPIEQNSALLTYVPVINLVLGILIIMLCRK